MPQLGDVLYVKSTEEPVIFQGSRKANWLDRDFDKGIPLYRVRRPMVSSNGSICHEFTIFAQWELETQSEQLARLYSKFKQQQALSMNDELNQAMTMGPSKLTVV